MVMIVDINNWRYYMTCSLNVFDVKFFHLKILKENEENILQKVVITILIVKIRNSDKCADSRKNKTFSKKYGFFA